MYQINNIESDRFKNIIRQDISRREIVDLIKFSNINIISNIAKNVRDACRPGPITYSRKVFINLINLCRDRCSYCTYKKELNDSDVSMLKEDQVLKIVETGKKMKCTEALIVTGEKPEQRYPEVKKWLKKQGCDSTIEYIDRISSMILKKTGLLPHTNSGTLSFRELSILKDTNVSIGCMLESNSTRLMGKKMAHEFAPSKNPNARIKVLENSGKLRIPITTGLLVGIGETFEEIIDSLFKIREINEKYDNIQEIIIQNFIPKFNTLMENVSPPSLDYYIRALCAARIILPQVNIQVPPNLSPKYYFLYLRSGINDWGGISPLTIDYVNPESPWPEISQLKNFTENEGHSLRARLPIYPEYILHKKRFISKDLWKYIIPLSDHEGLVKEDYLN